MEEIWKDVKGYEGRYQVSNKGRIKSFLKSSRYPDEKGHVIKPHIARGYAFSCLSKNGKAKNYLVHRLVAQAFIPNPNNLKEINHIDENKLNNCVENLEWCTRNYNMAYGTARIRQGISLGKPVEQLAIDGIPIAIYASAEIASKITGIDPSSIRGCCIHEREYAGGYSWRYSDTDFQSKYHTY